VIVQVTGAAVAFWMLAPVMVLAALGMLLARKAVHCALMLATVMICLAIQYAALEAPFLFAVQIIVYTGAILMLFLFVLMLVGVDASDSLVETIRGQRGLGALAAVGFAVLLMSAVGSAVYGEAAGLGQAQPDGNPKALAQLLFTKYVWAFEVSSALLITAALGAMMLAHRERLTKKRTQRDHAEERIRKYAEQGIHPGPLPTPGVLARHNAVDTPALLPDGSIAPTSVSRVLQARGTVFPEADERSDIEEVRKLNAGEVGDEVPSEPESTDLSGFGEEDKL
jgi:NADH-quinone oxidoreductase subunit J